MTGLVRIATRLGGIVVGVLSLAACTSQPAASEKGSSPAPDVTPVAITLPISINEVMVSGVDHAAHEVWNAPVPEKSPKTEQDWTELEHHALQLVTLSRTILLPGTGKADPNWVKSPDWTKNAQALTDASSAALTGIRAKDLNAINAAGDKLVMSCEDCHKAFKPDIPSEGKFHPHYR